MSLLEAAFFDLDGTLMSRSSTFTLGRPLYEAGLISRETVVRSVVAQAQFLLFGADQRKLDRARDGILALTKGWRQGDVERVVREAVDKRIAPFIHLPVRRLADQHRAAGREVYLVSTSPEEVVRPLAEYLGIDHVIATRAEVVDGIYTGRLSFYCFGEAKATALEELVSARQIDLAASFAYSDSASDLPMLLAVGHPVAVDPDKKLRRVALDRGWEIMEAPSNKAVYRTAGAAGLAVGTIWTFGYMRGRWRMRRARKAAEKKRRRRFPF